MDVRALVPVLALLISSAVTSTHANHGGMAVDANGNLVVTPPSGGRVLIDNVDCRAEVEGARAAVNAANEDLEQLRTTQKEDISLLNQVLCDSGVLERVRPQQKILTFNAWDVEHFAMGGDDYAAFANYQSDAGIFTLNTTILKWASDTRTFHPHQTLPSNGARDCEAFDIDGVQYLGVAHFHAAESPIFVWDKASNKFQPSQVLNKTGIVELEHFVIDQVHYLGASVAQDDGGLETMSHIYRWNGPSQIFESFQAIETTGANDMEFFVKGGDHFLAIANYQNSTTHNVESLILKWNPSSKQFDEHQRIRTHAATDWEYFEIGGESFLAVSNYYDDNSNAVDSAIYKHNPSSDLFEAFLQVDTTGAFDWEHFSFDGKDFLLVANRNSLSTFSLPSTLYVYDKTGNTFKVVQQIDTHGATSWQFMELDGYHYVAVTNANTDETVETDSVLFTLVDGCV